jgi:electron-transferring-flavoprotein dehydrogenase
MGIRPLDFPPPFAASEFVASSADASPERIDVGVAIVGAGPAGLACAIRLGQILAAEPALAETLGEVPVAVLEKGRAPGAHELSGAVVAPAALRELLPDVDFAELGGYGEVEAEAVYLLAERRSLRLPTPPPFHNKGNHVFSIARLAAALAERAEELGIVVLPESDARRLIVDGGRIGGVETGAKGLDRAGDPKPGAAPPTTLLASAATVLAEGTQGHLRGVALDTFDGHGPEAQISALGVKEVWKVARPLDRVIHTLGWPLRARPSLHEFGGSFVYPLGPEHVSIGFVVGLDYADSGLDPHALLQRLKTHPRIRPILEGGERVAWGAKTIPEGGWHAIPRTLALPGALLVGDSAGLVNVPRLKGVHYAIRSGMLAAEAIAGSLRGDARALDGYDAAVRASEIGVDLRRVRNMRQAFRRGLVAGGALAGAMEVTGGRFPGGTWATERDGDVGMSARGAVPIVPDGALTFDKLSSVYLSGNRTRDDQPDHLRVARRVPRALAETWVNLCPAAVYEVVEGSGEADGTVAVGVAPSNCVQCGAINAKGGRLTPPEGGSGPEYRLT